MTDKDTHLRVHIIVTGRVQNVGFRSYVQKVALTYSINGWVRNVKYDQLEIVAEGNSSLLQDFIGKIKVGPRGSRVDDVDVSPDLSSEELLGFFIRSSL